MSPRLRKASDEDIFAAAQRAMTQRGPHELTLADIAAEAGVTPGRLVQRFGSKRALLLALSEQFAGSAGAVFGGLRAAHPRPLAALRAYAACMAGLAATPQALARNLAYLHVDLTDPDFRTHLLANARATRRHLAALLDDAAAAGELRAGVDTRSLARLIDTVVNGSLMTWACYRDGSAAAWLRRDVDALLLPYVAQRRRGRPTGASRTG